jgi:hypothetical protein
MAATAVEGKCDKPRLVVARVSRVLQSGSKLQ